MHRTLTILGYVLAAFALAASFIIDLENALPGGAIDLRNRITGVRLMEAGIDPYHYKWRYGDPEMYCDVYNNPHLPVSKTTVTPSLLLLHAPYAAMPYRLGQFLWLFTQWGLLAGTGILWLRFCPETWQRYLVIAFVIGFTYTSAWRLHAERGQSYVALAFLLSAWQAWTLKPSSRNDLAAGFLAGFLVTLRPTFLLLAPFLGLHRREQCWGAMAGLATGFLLPLAVLPSIWSHYFAAMSENSAFYLSDDTPHPGQQRYPGTIENTSTPILAHFQTISFADFSTCAMLRDLGLGHCPGWPFEALGVVGFIIWLGLTRNHPAEKLLPGLAAWFFVIDLALPVYRQSYNDVLALAIVGCALATAKKLPIALAFAAMALGAGWFVAWNVPEAHWLINMPALGFTLMALVSIFFIDNRLALRKV